MESLCVEKLFLARPTSRPSVLLCAIRNYRVNVCVSFWMASDWSVFALCGCFYSSVSISMLRLVSVELFVVETSSRTRSSDASMQPSAHRQEGNASKRFSQKVHSPARCPRTQRSASTLSLYTHADAQHSQTRTHRHRHALFQLPSETE